MIQATLTLVQVANKYDWWTLSVHPVPYRVSTEFPLSYQWVLHWVPTEFPLGSHWVLCWFPTELPPSFYWICIEFPLSSSLSSHWTAGFHWVSTRFPPSYRWALPTVFPMRSHWMLTEWAGRCIAAYWIAAGAYTRTYVLVVLVLYFLSSLFRVILPQNRGRGRGDMEQLANYPLMSRLGLSN
jgi:hypothetical protein